MLPAFKQVHVKDYKRQFRATKWVNEHLRLVIWYHLLSLLMILKGDLGLTSHPDLLLHFICSFVFHKKIINFLLPTFHIKIFLILVISVKCSHRMLHNGIEGAKMIYSLFWTDTSSVIIGYYWQGEAFLKLELKWKYRFLKLMWLI